MLRRKVARGARRGPASRRTATAARTCSRSSRPTRATSCSRSPSTTCYATVLAVHAPAGAPPDPAVPARDDYGRLRLLPGLPAARPLHHRGPAADGGRSCARRSTAATVDYTARVSESRAGPAALRRPAAARAPRLPDGRRRASSRRGWSRRPGPGTTTSPTRCAPTSARRRRRRLLRRWGRGFPEAYKEDFTARVAVADLRRSRTRRRGRPTALGRLADLYEPVGRRRGRAPVQALPAGAPLSLSAVLPFLTNLGVEVVDERPYELAAPTARTAWIYDFGLPLTGGRAAGAAAEREPRDLFSERSRPRGGRPRPTASTGWCCSAGLTWRQVIVLRAYAKYLRQAGTTFSQDYIERCLRAERRRSPGCWSSCSRPASTPTSTAGSRAEGRRELTDACSKRSQAVPGRGRQPRPRPDPALVPRPGAATVRTNSFQRRPTRSPKPYLSFKLDPRGRPRPARSRGRRTRSSSTRRGSRACTCGSATVARGGLRWSDRREDFRTEVLGLVKAQTVKNAVIVPTGAKGGFVGKQLPDPAVDREAWLAEGIACYTIFIGGLLDVTDNLVDGRRSSSSSRRSASCATTATTLPRGRRRQGHRDVLRHRQRDRRRVRLLARRRVRLRRLGRLRPQGDGHHRPRRLGVGRAALPRARHRRPVSEDFTVRRRSATCPATCSATGCCCREHIRLVAAFDHRHVFLDPDPDPAASFAERRAAVRAAPIVAGPTTTPALISAGGGVYPRTAKSIADQPAGARRGSGCRRRDRADPGRADQRDPARRRSTCCGTAASAPTSRRRPRRTPRSATRPTTRSGSTAPSCGCRVVGEGGNLGLTQRGRIEAALAGGRVNTDAIDNSAGVDTSDHEVNIKILLDRMVARRRPDRQAAQRAAGRDDRRGRRARAARQLRAERRCSATPASQSLAMVTRARAVHPRRSRPAACSTGRWSSCPRTTPSSAQRAEEGRGLTSPEFAVLVAYAKIALDRRPRRLRACPTIPGSRATLRGYFPPAAARALRRPARHPPAAPRDHHDLPGERDGQPRRDHLRLPRARRRPGPTPSRWPGPTRCAARCSACATSWRAGRGARQACRHRGADPALPGVPAAARPVGALVPADAARPARHRRRDRPVRARWSPSWSRCCPSCSSATSTRRCRRRRKRSAALGVPERARPARGRRC